MPRLVVLYMLKPPPHPPPPRRRAARYGDGWSSAMMPFVELAATIDRVKGLLADYGRAGEPFEFQAVCIDRFGVDGYRQQADAGVTDAVVMPWVFDGLPFDADIRSKKDSIRKFADEIIAGIAVGGRG
jgi:alkanesulfonate monooxygenase SsuD/methylene tetrahydromethanopterin reductase-like flavin-dependent oxidoreductase (luciferase family)